MRVVALGFWSGERSIEYITTEQRLGLTNQDVVIVDSKGDRLVWAYEGMKRQVSDVLPTSTQKEELHTFLEQGGTIITFPADPFMPLTIPLYPEEMPSHWDWKNYQFVISGGLAEIEIPTFDWLPAQIWMLLKEIHDMFSQENTSSIAHVSGFNQMPLTIMSTPQAIMICVGRGKLIVCREPSYLRQLLSTSVAPRDISSVERAA